MFRERGRNGRGPQWLNPGYMLRVAGVDRAGAERVPGVSLAWHIPRLLEIGIDCAGLRSDVEPAPLTSLVQLVPFQVNDAYAFPGLARLGCERARRKQKSLRLPCSWAREIIQPFQQLVCNVQSERFSLRNSP